MAEQDIVERLRLYARNHEGGFPQRLLYTVDHQKVDNEAADRLEAVEAENASLRQQLAEARADGKLFDALASNSWDLRCISVPTGGDDYDIEWVIIEHHQAVPHERAIAQAYKDDPRAAILRAMRATDPNAERCVSCGEVLHDGDSVYHEHGEGGHIHSWCVDDPDSFVDEDGEPAPSKPTPFAYSALPHPDREGERPSGTETAARIVDTQAQYYAGHNEDIAKALREAAGAIRAQSQPRPGREGERE